jgi:hypothetical protein
MNPAEDRIPAGAWVPERDVAEFHLTTSDPRVAAGLRAAAYLGFHVEDFDDAQRRRARPDQVNKEESEH